MSATKNNPTSILHDTVEGVYRKAEQELKAAEAEAEIEFHGLLAGLRAEGCFDSSRLEDYARDLAFRFGERASDEFLERVNLAIGTQFDPHAIDPESFADDPHGAEMLQLQVGYADHLEAHLRDLIAAHAASFTTGAPPATARRLRPSGLADSD